MGIISAKNLLPHVERRMKFVRFVSRWVQLYCFPPHQNRYSIIRQRSPARASKLLIRFRYWSRAISFSFQTNCLIATTTTTTIFPPAINWAFFRLIKNHEMKPGNELLTMPRWWVGGFRMFTVSYEEESFMPKALHLMVEVKSLCCQWKLLRISIFNLWHGVLATVTHVLHLTIKKWLAESEKCTKLGEILWFLEAFIWRICFVVLWVDVLTDIIISLMNK